MTERRPRPAEARLEELPRAAGSAPSSWARVRVGLLVEQGLLTGEAVRAWQRAVREGEFDADACALELGAEPVAADADERVRRRTAGLLRDLLMAPVMRSSGRTGRRRAKTALAVLFSQVYLLLVVGGLLLVAVLVLRMRGVAFDPLLDRLLGVFG